MKDITRRNFLQVSAATGAVAALAGCTSSDDSAAGSDAGSAVASAGLPNAADYPIDPDGDDVEALWTSEEMRDGWTKVTNPDGSTLGVMDTSKIIQVSGYAFKDLDGNGKLDFYEDWRQDKAERAASLATELTAEECIQLMWHGGVTDSDEDAEDPDYGAIAKGSCAGVSRLGTTIDSYATDIEWVNTVQQKCEERAYGIPYLNSTDPYTTLDLPSTVGLAPAMDKDLWRKAGMWTSRAWRASGMTVELGPQIDLYTEPRVARLNGAESEDPALVRDFTQAFGGGLQSTWADDEATEDEGWGDDSVAIMLKHYVGAGAIETGCNDHYDVGKYDVFPNDNYNAHLIGFLDGGLNLDSSTGQMSAIMPNYGMPYSEDEEYGEVVGGGFNKRQISILRNAGWDGMICTDWGIIGEGTDFGGGRGVEDLTRAERYEKIINADVDQYGGSFEPTTTGAEAYELLVADLGEDATLERLQNSARRIFTVMMNVGLFEQPYADRTVAKEVFESEEAAAFSSECNDKCVIMLKNAGGVISADGIGDKPKVYIPQTYTAGATNFWTGTTTNPTISSCFDESVAAEYFDVVTDTIGDPTGDADADGNATYLESDIVRPTADDLADVQYAVIEIQNPQDAYTGYEEAEDGTITWKPITMQYRPYTADSDAVPQSAIGDTLEDGTMDSRDHYGESTYATNESELDLVIDTKANLPEGAKLILIVNVDHPMCFHEIEPYADVILMGWDYLPDAAFAHIIAGEAEPYGLLQFQMPLDMDAVESQACDTPRDMDCYVDSEGNTYDFCFGLNWSGVIDDERTATYNVSPLTEPETQIVRDEA